MGLPVDIQYCNSLAHISIESVNDLLVNLAWKKERPLFLASAYISSYMFYDKVEAWYI